MSSDGKSSELKLQNKVAVITAATSGMALATAKLFVEQGAFVFITGRRKDELDLAVKSIGKNVVGVQGDAGNLKDLDKLFEAVKAHKKTNIDILFASAGKGDLDKPLESVTEEVFDSTFDLNVRGTLFLVQKALPFMKTNGGSIILNGSIAASKGFPGNSVYAASKAAVRAFARGWTQELISHKIRVNVLSPGPIDTAVFSTGIAKESREAFASMVPMKRLGKPSEIATVALFLASDDSSFISGIELCVDGGLAQL
jgi:NAD(P)-dependent dehydrogenase (short-subunit alcohol dehydrogenase family)